CEKVCADGGTNGTCSVGRPTVVSSTRVQIVHGDELPGMCSKNDEIPSSASSRNMKSWSVSPYCTVYSRGEGGRGPGWTFGGSIRAPYWARTSATISGTALSWKIR